MTGWTWQRMHTPYRAGEGHETDRGSLSTTLLRLIREEPLRERTILDVGCGNGHLTFVLAQEAGRIIGIDWSAEAIEEARQHAARLGLTHVTFCCCDAEGIEYRALGPIDLVVANLCMSDEIIRRAAETLAPGRCLIFAAFHRDQWKESGKTSRFAYEEGRLKTILSTEGFESVYLGVEHEVLSFASADEALAYLETTGLAARWTTDSRWTGFRTYLQGGGLELTTRARVIVKARRR